MNLDTFGDHKISVKQLVHSLRKDPNTNHILWSVYQNDFYYITYKEYEKLKIRPDIKTFTFKLNKYKGKSNNVDDLKRILYGS